MSAGVVRELASLSDCPLGAKSRNCLRRRGPTASR